MKSFHRQVAFDIGIRIFFSFFWEIRNHIFIELILNIHKLFDLNKIENINLIN